MKILFPRALRVAVFLCLVGTATAAAVNTAVVPVPPDLPPALWMERHEEFVQTAAHGGVAVLFLGDSITDYWRCYTHAGYLRGKSVWDRAFAPLHAENFGIGGDRTQHLLWRVRHGELDGLYPKAVVLQIGTNNLGQIKAGSPNNTPAETLAGVAAIVAEIRTQLPDARILLLGIFPRGEKGDPLRGEIREVNRGLAALDDGKSIRFLDFGARYLQPDGALKAELMPDLLHPNTAGYQIWADAIQAPVAAMLVAPSPVDPAWPALPPDFANVRYGPHERNFLDLWLPKGAAPAPLLVYIHGGGWIFGDKTYAMADAPALHLDLVRLMLSHGIAVASINYRYTTMAPLPAPVADAARAVQFLRSRAKEWHLNSKRVAAFGTSAGGCTTLWLAYHPDLADPANADPVLRESTRLCAAEGWVAQTSIDPGVIGGWVGEQVLNHPMIWKAVGAADRADVAAHYERWAGLYREYSPYTHVARGAPPVFVAYGLAPAPGASPGLAIHNLQFGVRLKAKADAVGATCLVWNKDLPDPALPRPYDFLLQNLLAP